MYLLRLMPHDLQADRSAASASCAGGSTSGASVSIRASAAPLALSLMRAISSGPAAASSGLIASWFCRWHCWMSYTAADQASAALPWHEDASEPLMLCAQGPSACQAGHHHASLHLQAHLYSVLTINRHQEDCQQRLIVHQRSLPTATQRTCRKPCRGL
jgi:hypothetical protein